MDYEWDADKAATNREKHGIEFADAALALEDDAALTRSDTHPDEDRFVTLGTDALGRVLVVVWTARGEDTLRLISAPGHPRRTSPLRRGITNTMQDEYDFSAARRGAVVSAPPGTTAVTLRLDDAVLDWFRQAVNDAGGGSYQTLINRVLSDYVQGQREPQNSEPLEDTLRRVLREELHNAV